MKSKKLFILFLAIPLIALCSLIVRRGASSNGSTPLASSGKNPKGKWSHLEYTSINSNTAIASKLASTIRFETGKLANWPTNRTDKISDLIRDYLRGYSEGDFETYWRFRVPAERAIMTEDSVEKLRKFIKNQQQVTHIEVGGVDAFGKLSQPKELMRLVWQAMAYPREHNGVTVSGCLSCYESVAVENIRINQIPMRGQGMSDMREPFVSQITKYPRSGFVLQEGFVQAQPDHFAESRDDPANFHFVSIMLPVRLKSGYTLSAFLFAYWSNTEGRFIPQAHGYGDSSVNAPRVLF